MDTSQRRQETFVQTFVQTKQCQWTIAMPKKHQGAMCMKERRRDFVRDCWVLSTRGGGPCSGMKEVTREREVRPCQDVTAALHDLGTERTLHTDPSFPRRINDLAFARKESERDKYTQ